jgi:hypothetical protein
MVTIVFVEGSKHDGSHATQLRSRASKDLKQVTEDTDRADNHATLTQRDDTTFHRFIHSVHVNCVVSGYCRHHKGRVLVVPLGQVHHIVASAIKHRTIVHDVTQHLVRQGCAVLGQRHRDHDTFTILGVSTIDLDTHHGKLRHSFFSHVIEVATHDE